MLTPRLAIALVVAAALNTACVVAPYPYGYPTTGTAPANFDRSWDAALGAANDVGVQVSNADRSTGRITGSKAGAPVTIDLRPQADNSLQVSFNAPTSTEKNPTLGERWSAAYNRRMGR